MEMPKKKEGVELLRICMMLSIVYLHISGRFSVDDCDSLTRSLHHFLRSFAFVGVSGFAFISGYFGIKWNLQKFLKLEFVAITMGLLLVLFKLIVYSEFCARDLLNAVTPIMSRDCWYFSAYMLLMLLSPFLNNELFFKNSNHVKLLITLLAFFVYIGGFVYRHDGTTVVYLIMVYLLGRYFFYFPNDFIKKNAGKIAGGGLMLNGAIAFILAYLNVKGNLFQMFCNNHNPLLIISAVGLFFVAIKLKTDVNYSRLSRYMLSVYLAHGLALHMKLITFDYLCDCPLFARIAIYVVFVFLASIMCEIARNLVFGLFEKKLINAVCKVEKK